ncbi:LacI family DNA-binding transcriptional regulator [Curtobacterium sp. MCPF17_052]|uniref:LacI family DNA-binding transcriptional regulator n=1 Tax=Curtobacterium sp. MCPF17_052 TaxID=2175655 RepID=UPI0024DFBE84|nr:LacI family DNA-binding transcriptional regulator [Curtobacterium sp. MCPF17_052]WIB13853.1 LacI family DNA-binding transcriptional regulator [Curtobacterium sp. MCPF17_052]
MARPPQLTGTSGRATILDVAAAAGVSRQTVTRAVNGLPGISDATKGRVLAAAEQLDYRPSRFGRGARVGRHPPARAARRRPPEPVLAGTRRRGPPAGGRARLERDARRRRSRR